MTLLGWLLTLQVVVLLHKQGQAKDYHQQVVVCKPLHQKR